MRVRVLHAKLYAYALPGSTARQLFISSTLLDSSTARQLLDRPRQTSTALDAQPRGVRKSQARQARQELDSNSTGSTGKASTAPRQRLDRGLGFFQYKKRSISIQEFMIYHHISCLSHDISLYIIYEIMIYHVPRRHMIYLYLIFFLAPCYIMSISSRVLDDIGT